MCCAWRCYINMKNKCEVCGCNICKKMVWKSPLPLYFLLDYFTLQHYVIIIISKVLYDHTCHNTQTMHVQHVLHCERTNWTNTSKHTLYMHIYQNSKCCAQVCVCLLHVLNMMLTFKPTERSRRSLTSSVFDAVDDYVKNYRLPSAHRKLCRVYCCTITY